MLGGWQDEQRLGRPNPGCFSGEYHDTVWGIPVTDTTTLFGQLSLITQQCGVSWEIVWKKREHYRQAFCDWDMHRVAAMTEADLDRLCDKDGPWAGRVMQNRPKLAAIVHNARLCVQIEEEHDGGLVGYLWGFVKGREEETVNPHERDSAAYQEVFGETSAFSDALAAALKKGRGFKYIGSITLQVTGHVSDGPPLDATQRPEP
jgi:DNA-3-methyladenine glycosylase I